MEQSFRIGNRPVITGIKYVTLSIKNVRDSFDFYTRVLGAQPIAKWHNGAYVLLGDL
ncbi:MAG: VOC family protein [Chloroflexi bacterium]|nr:VOC family protein [Chloroflexota bacterium]